MWIQRNGAKKKMDWVQGCLTDGQYTGLPLAVVIKLCNCTDNDSVCLQVKTLHDTEQRRLCHPLALLQMSFCKNKNVFLWCLLPMNQDYSKVVGGFIVTLLDDLDDTGPKATSVLGVFFFFGCLFSRKKTSTMLWKFRTFPLTQCNTYYGTRAIIKAAL